MEQLKLWYQQPAAKWTEALPIGNGHTGAMVYGGTAHEKLGLTEITCYSGEASWAENNQEGAPAYLPEIRRALFEHDYKTANQAAEHIIGKRLNYGTNLPFADLLLHFEEQDGEVSAYTRGLQLDTAVASVGYASGDTEYSRSVFVSHPHKVLILHLSCNNPGKLSFGLELDGAGNPFTVSVEDGDLVLNGNAWEAIHSDGRTGVALHARMRVLAEGGEVLAAEGKLQVKGVDSAVVLLALATDFEDKAFVDTCKKRIETAAALRYEELLDTHIKDHQALFGRVGLELDCSDSGGLPTDQRLSAVQRGSEDPALAALMFQYGRYLLVSSSRPDSPLPAHLQGIWNDNIACRMGWTCDMHLDINTEMNYWPSEITNLSECNRPLFKWIEERLVPSGRQTAKRTYGLDGWVAHVVSNAWGYSAPGWATSWGIHPTGGLWVATHLWEHYLFTGDKDFLKHRLLPVYKEAVKFFLAYLVRDPGKGYYLSGPSMSPENCFQYDWNNPYVSSISMGTVCDTVMIRELFDSFIKTCGILGLEDELLPEAREKLEGLPPLAIGMRGQLQEWYYDYDEPDPYHRHTSHLLSVFPYGQVDPDLTPELAKAARATIRKRTTPDWRWEDTGWARALLLLHTVRLHDAQEAYRHILAFQRGLTNINLLSFCPPGAGADTDVFEMDGTTGFCTAVAEMLLQSHNGVINLLPALPEQWGNGRVMGLRARGGYEVGLTWQEHELAHGEIRSVNGGECCLKYRGGKVLLQLEKGRTYKLDKDLNIIP